MNCVELTAGEGALPIDCLEVDELVAFSMLSVPWLLAMSLVVFVFFLLRSAGGAEAVAFSLATFDGLSLFVCRLVDLTLVGFAGDNCVGLLPVVAA